MVKELYRRFSLSFLLLPFFLLLGCQEARQSSLSVWLQPNNPTLVNFPLSASAQIYSFNASATSPTQLTLYPVTPNLSYTAEVRDNRGGVIATLGSGLQNAVLTIAPGDGLYEIAIKSDSADHQGMLSLLVSGLLSNPAPQSAAYNASAQPVATPAFKIVSFANTNTTALCTARSSANIAVNIRSGPGLDSSIISSLPSASSIGVSGRSNNNWVQVNLNGQIGWISGAVIILDGACDGLPNAMPSVPTLAPTPIPTVIPFASDAFHLDIDRDGWGDFSENIAYTDNPRRDLIQLTISGLSNIFSNDYREFTLTLVCSGSGTDGVRWGAPQQPSLHCGQSTVMPFTAEYNRQLIAVALNNSPDISKVNYTLLASKH